jgi:hypothetical protein
MKPMALPLARGQRNSSPLSPFLTERAVARLPAKLLSHERVRAPQAGRPQRPACGPPREPQDHLRAPARVGGGLAAAGRGCRGAFRGHRVGARYPQRAVRHGRMDAGQPRIVDPTRRSGPAARRGTVSVPGGDVPPSGGHHAGGSVPGVGRAWWRGHDRAGVLAVRLQLPAGRRADQGTGPGYRLPDRCRLHR